MNIAPLFTIFQDPEVHARIIEQQQLIQRGQESQEQEPTAGPSLMSSTVMVAASSSGVRHSPSLTSPSPVSSAGGSEVVHTSSRSPAAVVDSSTHSSDSRTGAVVVDGGHYVAITSPTTTQSQPQYVDSQRYRHTSTSSTRKSGQGQTSTPSRILSSQESRRVPLSAWPASSSRPFEPDTMSSASPATSWSSTTTGPARRDRRRRSSGLRESSEEDSELEERERRLAEEEAKLAEYERLVLRSEKMAIEAKKAKIEQRELEMRRRREQLQKRLAEAVSTLEDSKGETAMASEEESLEESSPATEEEPTSPRNDATLEADHVATSSEPGPALEPHASTTTLQADQEKTSTPVLRSSSSSGHGADFPKNLCTIDSSVSATADIPATAYAPTTQVSANDDSSLAEDVPDTADDDAQDCTAITDGSVAEDVPDTGNEDPQDGPATTDDSVAEDVSADEASLATDTEQTTAEATVEKANPLTAMPNQSQGVDQTTSSSSPSEEIPSGFMAPTSCHTMVGSMPSVVASGGEHILIEVVDEHGRPTITSAYVAPQHQSVDSTQVVVLGSGDTIEPVVEREVHAQSSVTSAIQQPSALITSDTPNYSSQEASDAASCSSQQECILPERHVVEPSSDGIEESETEQEALIQSCQPALAETGQDMPDQSNAQLYTEESVEKTPSYEVQREEGQRIEEEVSVIETDSQDAKERKGGHQVEPTLEEESPRPGETREGDEDTPMADASVGEEAEALEANNEDVEMSAVEAQATETLEKSPAKTVDGQEPSETLQDNTNEVCIRLDK
jgi:hypothetical protein